MSNTLASAWINFSKDTTALSFGGAWVTQNSASCEAAITSLEKQTLISQPQPTHPIKLDGSAISAMDSLGAWLLKNIIEKFSESGITIALENFKQEQLQLIEFVKHQPHPNTDDINQKIPRFLYRLGYNVVCKAHIFVGLINFIGELCVRLALLIRNPARFRAKAFLNQIEQCGYRALPIVALLSFLIGVVLTYQMGLQLKLYGADIFVVDLLGLAILREFGPLITAIVVIGRTGSAFTAQLGTMKIHQETEALTVIGVSPFDMLVLPRILALILVLPLLTLWADVFGVLGGMFMANNILDISFTDFLQRFQRVVSQTPFLLGIIKAPVFALLISVVGCFHGFRVSGSAQSVGENTTKSMVLAIFLIIIADAAFSILYSWLGL